jgi:hypothetical protein
MYVRQEFKEHVTLKDITMYLIACAEMSVYVAIGKYVGVSGISSMRELFIFEICVFPIYLLVAKLMDKGFFTNKAK